MDHNPGTSSSNQFDSNDSQTNPTAEVQATANALIGEVAQNAKQVAGDLASRARQMAEEQLSSAKQMAADRIGSVADALRATGDQLRSQDAGGVSDYVDQAVDRLDAASGYLQNRSFSDLVSDVEGYARREPAIFFGGVFLAGLIAGRFLKSSSQPRAMPADDISRSDLAGTTGVEGRGELERNGYGDRSFVPGVV